jgi:Domain of unknown function (DUF927)
MSMGTRKFLTIVWPPRGPYCIASPWVKPDGETVMAHRGCETLDDVIAYVLTKKQSKDLYFAAHTLKVVREENPKTGKLQTFRTHTNMKEACVFFFDIDAGGPRDHYTTQDDILNALEKFLFETGLPSPFVVNSGYGIHVYWIIDTPIESLTWREPAARLYWLAQQHKLHVDPSRTKDQSSVLRVPGTFNLKDPSNLRPVVILAEGVVTPTAEFLAQLGSLTGTYTPDTPKTNGKAAPEPGLSVAWSGRCPSADEVADVCEHIRTFRDSRGNVSEPAWHAGIGTIKYCDDGTEKVHEWSSGYPGYTAAETQTKLDTWVVPPPGCEKIGHNSGDPTICARCPHKDVAKNPLLIANIVYEATHQPVPGPAATSTTPEVPCLPPAPYTLDMTDGIRDKKTLICDMPMFPINWIRATTNENCLSHWYVKPPLCNWERIEILNDELELNALARALRNKGIITTHLKFTKNIHMFMLSYLKELKRHQADLHQYDYVGLEIIKEPGKPPTDIGDAKYFIMYGRKISVVDGSVTPCIMTKNTQIDGMGRAGSLARQIALMEFYNKPQYMAQQFAIAASLATPFYHYSNQHGVLICLVGETGSSKSTGAFSAASLWGHPERYCISGLTSNATDKARQELEAICRNQPFIVDEITLFDESVVNEIALAASQLGSRKSLKTNREFRDERGGYKANLTICTSNTSLVQKINATNPGGQASIMRIFEIKVTQNDARSKIEADSFMRQLVKNYGWIGEDFLCRCLPHREAIGDKFLEIQQQLETDIGARQEERFMTAAAATALLGIKLGNKLGYFNFSYKAMREWLINVQIPTMRGTVEHERKHMAPETILNEYLEEISPNMCRINKNTRGEIEVLYAPPIAECKARYEIARGEVYVRIGPFKDYCNRRHHDYNDILDRLYKSGPVIIKSDKKRMRAEPGTLDNPVTCFVVSVKTASPIAVPNTPEPDDKSRKIVEFKTR